MPAKTTLHFCTSQAWGGLELYACTMMIQLRNRGWKVWAVCYPDSKVEEYLRAHDILTLNVPSYAKLSVSSVRCINNLIRDEDIAVVHVHFHRDIWQASLAMRREKQRKLLMSIYMGVNKKRDIFHRYIYNRVDAIFTSSIEMNKVLHERYPVPASKIHYLPYGREIEQYQRDETKRQVIRKQYGIDSNQIVLGAMMRIDPGKCVLDFVESFMHLTSGEQEQCTYLVIGEPTRKRSSTIQESPFELHCEEYYFKIKDYITTHNLEHKIHLCGFQSDVTGYLSAMDAFVFPSRDELFSLVVLDAMAMQLPVIAANAGGNIHQISDGISGFLFEVGNSCDLASKIRYYLHHQQELRTHGNSARNFVVAHHAMSASVDQLLHFYQ